MTLTYRAAIDRMLTLADFERRSRAAEPPDWHLRRMEVLLARLGDPHLAVPVVHVAGSKGKGSTSAMIASVLRAAGYRTGLYTSPHLHRFSERIQVDAVPVSGDKFAGLIERLWPEVEAIEAQGALGNVSVFELLTAMAFVHFKEARCDAAVIEVGLGGRLDATNLVRPVLSVITPISLDHVHILGDTIAKIALEKAGIIKPGATVVLARQEPAARKVFEMVAREKRSPLVDAMASVGLVSEDTPSEGPQSFVLRGAQAEYRLTLPLLGAHQVDNCRAAVAALEVMSASGWSVSAAAVELGLSEVRWPARAEIVTQGPPLILADGALNEASARALAATLARHFPGRSPVVLVAGGTIGHDYTSMVRTLVQACAGDRGQDPVRLVVTRSRHPKAVPPGEFAAALEDHNVHVAAQEPDMAAALERARAMAGPSGIVAATGSLFIAAEAIELIKGTEPEIYPDLKGAFTQPYAAGAGF